MHLPVLEEHDRLEAYCTQAPKTRAPSPPRKTAPTNKAPHTNPPVKHTVPLTPSGKKARVKTKHAPITVKGKARKNLAWTENMIVNLYAARQEHRTEFTLGNVLAKGAWKSVLETWKELVEDDDNPDTMASVLVCAWGPLTSGCHHSDSFSCDIQFLLQIMLATIEVETKHLVNK
ncbi:hypothetical protein BDK51DRAFT_42355 [Blyttiomyces helicus]|uniref:Uncharacterized protein n=1 Tax=Blyttiomyces helicus TaxID=388810 RepID=A0A4V1IQZ1_9FUNG|nr:hypothetical protein BDK51DRAFT_42355 [Blyttiomyces helicus]|eukprot:RKO88237.1 hypothetical protein BDK51DRAFT_42355 [Blyttiomyces helicus]